MLLTPKEIAQRLRISQSKAYSLLARGQIRSFKIGACVRVAEEDLERFLEENRHEPVQLPAPQHRHF